MHLWLLGESTRKKVSSRGRGGRGGSLCNGSVISLGKGLSCNQKIKIRPLFAPQIAISCQKISMNLSGKGCGKTMVKDMILLSMEIRIHKDGNKMDKNIDNKESR